MRFFSRLFAGFLTLVTVADATEYDVTTRRIAIWRDYDPSETSMTVCVAGACRVVNNYAFTAATVPQPYFMLVEGASEITVTGGTVAQVVSMPNMGVLQPGTYEENHSGIEYLGSWIWQTRAGPSNGHVYSAIERDSSLSFSFNGTAVEIGAVTYDDRHSVKICIDAVCQERNLYSTTLGWQVPILISGLSPGVHRVEMSSDKGKAIDLDWLRVFAPIASIPAGTTAHDADARIAKSGGDRFFYVSGKRATLRFTTGPDYGETYVCFDTNCVFIDLYNYRAGTRDVPFLASSAGIYRVSVTQGRTRFLDLISVKVD